jgi:16S rRNA (guanine966-N2)-methyltransferase
LTGTVRIIAGQWRGRKLAVIPLEGLRPTPDRVRETLFNWLHTSLHSSRCLDLFAGSGGLSFEAASRGAKSVVMVEKHRRAAQQLHDNIQVLQASEQMQLHNGSAYDYLNSVKSAFDIIFLDPPFRQGHIEKTLSLIFQHKLLLDQGLIYLEYEAEIKIDLSPWNLKILKQSQAGQSCALLLRYEI